VISIAVRSIDAAKFAAVRDTCARRMGAAPEEIRRRA
jgi:hypothetical protein